MFGDTYLRSGLAGLNRRATVRKEENPIGDEIHTCNFGVWTEIKGTIVVSGRVGAVGGNIPPDLGEIEAIDHDI